MSLPPPPQVLLLKTRSHPTDPYDIFFRAQGFDPVFIPVLKHRHVNLDAARRIVREGRIEGLGRRHAAAAAAAAEPEYGGIIVTSQRATEALGEVLESLQGMCACVCVCVGGVVGSG